MKKILCGVVAVCSLLPMLALAQVGDVNPNPTSTCVSVTHNLSYGSRDSQTGGDVSSLQFMLQSKGYLNSDPTGYFGLLTQNAVKSFQSANGILSSGYVGSITRGKISSICGTNSITSTTTPITISVPSVAPLICPAGALFNSITGAPCTTTVTPTSGCPIDALFNTMTGASCSGALTQPITPTPVSLSVHLYVSSGSQTSDTSISVNVGNKFTISGNPENLQGLSYYFGSGDPTAGYYARAFFFDQTFGNNNPCGSNEASPNDIWTMTCSANVPGSSAFYIEIYANGQTYRSNTVTVTVTSSSSVVTPQPTTTGILSSSPTFSFISADASVNAANQQNNSTSLSAAFRFTVTPTGNPMNPLELNSFVVQYGQGSPANTAKVTAVAVSPISNGTYTNGTTYSVAVTVGPVTPSQSGSYIFYLTGINWVMSDGISGQYTPSGWYTTPIEF